MRRVRSFKRRRVVSFEPGRLGGKRPCSSADPGPSVTILGMRLKVIKPPLHATHRRWKWQILGQRGDVLAESRELSEAGCENGINELQAALRAGKTLEVEEETRSS
jgi:hypothetical protein